MPQQKTETKKVSVNLPLDLIEAIDKAALADRRDRSGAIRVLLERALDVRKAG